MLPFGSLFEKGLKLATGQCNVKSYNRYLRDMIISGRAKPSFIIVRLSSSSLVPPPADECCDEYRVTNVASKARPRRTLSSTNGSRDTRRSSCIPMVDSEKRDGMGYCLM